MMRSLSQRHNNKLKMMQQLKPPDQWYIPGGWKLKPEFGVRCVTLILEGLRRSLDRRLSALSQSLEQDML